MKRKPKPERVELNPNACHKGAKWKWIDHGTYTCAGCGGTFNKTRSDEEAMAECRREFGNFPKAEYDIICDDCYKKFEAWLAKTQRSN